MNENTKELCLELMETAEAGFLTTIDEEGFPVTRAMCVFRWKPAPVPIFSGQLFQFNPDSHSDL